MAPDALPIFRFTSLLRIAAFASITTASLAQQGTAPVAPPVDAASIKVPAYEVVSIKPHKDEDKFGGSMSRSMPDGFTATGMTLQMLIRGAYDKEENEILEAPGWFKSEKYDIKAKIDDADIEAFKKLDREQANTMRDRMMQGMLADRFKLTLHHETREWPIYALVVAKSGSKLQDSKPENHKEGYSMRVSRGEMSAQGAPVSSIVRFLSGQLGHHVIDKTGLTGKYDYILKWAPEEGERNMFPAAPGGNAGSAALPAPDSNGPSIFTALQEQLGLKLESQKGPVDVLVIDHAEKSTAD
jgi:uncharacterized protein (TIGR03435 family)